MDIQKLYKTNPKLTKTDVVDLRKWMKTQPHLPKPDEKMIVIFLNCCDLNIEDTKKCIEYYYTIRSNFPELCTDRDPELPQNIKLLNVTFMEPLPERSSKGHVIFYAKLMDTSADNYDFCTHIKLLDMRIHTLLLQVGCVPGIELILDMEGITWRHWQKVSFLKAKKALDYLLQGYPVNLKGVHFVNPVYFLNTVLTVFYPFMPVELKESLKIHSKIETLSEVLPKCCIPNELGGSGGSTAELHRNYIKAIKENREYFVEDEAVKSDESRRIKVGFLQRIGL